MQAVWVGPGPVWKVGGEFGSEGSGEKNDGGDEFGRKSAGKLRKFTVAFL